MTSTDQDDQRDDLGARLAIGASWMIGARLMFRVVGLISTVFLARLLVPEDFGVVTLAMMIVGILQVISEFGFDMALIQNQQATRDHYDTVWTLSLLRGLGSALLMLAVAEPVSAFFNEPRLAGVMQVLALAPILMQSVNPGTADFRKHLNFRREFVYLILPKSLSVLVTVICAFAWRNYWALIVGILTYRGLQLAASFLLHSFRPRLSLRQWREIMNFSKWLLVSAIMTIVRKRASTLVIGRLAGSHMLGVFAIAYEISNLATSELVAPIKRALFPGYAKMAHDRDKLRLSFLNAFGLICLICIPLVAGIAVTAEHLVHVMLGDKWLEAIPFIQVLAVAGMIATCRGHSRPVYLALNRPSIGAYLTMIETGLFVALIAAGYYVMGPIGVAWAAVALEIVAMAMDVAILRLLLNIRLAQWFAEVWRPAVAVAAMSVAVLSLQDAAGDPRSTLEHAYVLFASAALGAVTYGAVLLGLWLLCGRPRSSAEWNLGAFVGSRLIRRTGRRSLAAAEQASAE